MESMKLTATKRDVKVDPEVIRADAKIPAVIYGGDREGAESLTLDRSETLKLLKDASSSTIIDVEIDGKVSPALVGEIQYHPVTDEILHIDLRQVDMNKSVKAQIDLRFEGEAPAVKLGGILVTNRDSINVKGKPGDLINEIVIDLGQLVDFDASVRVSDLELPAGIELDDEETATIVAARPPKKVVEKTPEEEAAEAAEGEEGEAAEGGEKPEGEAAEGGDAKAEEEKSE